MSQSYLLINLSGVDQPGISASLIGQIEKFNCNVVDIGQSLTYGLLSLSLVIEPPAKEHLSKLKNSLEIMAKKQNLIADIKEIEPPILEEKKSEKYIISCVSSKGITPSFLSHLTSLLADKDINIERINNVSKDKLVSLDIHTSPKKDSFNWDNLKAELISISNEHFIDLAMIKDDLWRTNKRLIVFDMDSTLIRSEVIVEMAKVHGVGDKVHAITEQAMNGEIDFDESLTKRVSLLKGMKKDQLDHILKNIQLTEGVEEFIIKVKELGYKTAIISGGFNYFADAFKTRLGLDYAFSNELEVKNEILTGKIKGPIVNAEKKAILLELLAQQENVKLEQVVAIGDGANDLKMLAKAGLGIAFHAKDIVKKSAKQQMSHGPMTSILYFLGINQE